MHPNTWTGRIIDWPSCFSIFLTNMKHWKISILLWFCYGSLWSTGLSNSVLHSEAQIAEGFEKLKLLRAAWTRWPSHGETTKCLVSQFQPLIDSLDMMIMKDWKLETIGIHGELLKPETDVLIISKVDVLVSINHFSIYLKKSLIFVDISSKFQQHNYLKEWKSCKGMVEVSLNQTPSHYPIFNNLPKTIRNLHKEQEIQGYLVKKEN